MVSQSAKDDFPQITIKDIKKLPFPDILNDDNRIDECNKIIQNVKTMLELHKRLQEAKTPDERVRLERQIKSTDQAIDELVYTLYGLTEEEKRIVEEGGL